MSSKNTLNKQSILNSKIDKLGKYIFSKKQKI